MERVDHRRQPTHRTVAPAAIAWEGARPVSLAFADIYHDVDGPGEVHRVFLAPARLSERFAASDTPVFTIGELGFGSGLNFIATAKRFLEVATETQSLHYISVDHAQRPDLAG